MRCVLCDDEHKTWFNICEYQKKKNRINAKNAKILKFYKINKNVLMINCETNDDFSTK